MPTLHARAVESVAQALPQRQRIEAGEGVSATIKSRPRRQVICIQIGTRDDAYPRGAFRPPTLAFIEDERESVA
jgi:hypothetical protein